MCTVRNADLTPEERVAAAKAAAEKVSAKLPTPIPAQPTVDPKAQAIEEKRKLLWNKKKEVCMYVHTNLRMYVHNIIMYSEYSLTNIMLSTKDYPVNPPYSLKTNCGGLTSIHCTLSIG